MKTKSYKAIQWPMNERLSYGSWIAGAAYGGWIGHLLEAGWATLLLLPLCALFGAITWMATAVVLVKLGDAVKRRGPIWLAITVQALALPAVLTIAALWFGGSGPNRSGRYGLP